MTPEEKIIQYILQISKGSVRLQSNQATTVINLVLNNSEKVVTVQRSVWNGGNECYDPSFTKIVSYDTAKAIVDKYKGTKQYTNFYVYRIQELNFEHYSVNPNLF